MQFDFDKIEERRGTNSLKWDVEGQELPLWVADMDFQTAPSVVEALKKRAEKGIFGYEIVPDGWYEAYQNWWRIQHQFLIEKEWLIFCTGVVPAISCAVKRMTNVGDNILVQTPVYNIFFHSIENHGRHVLENKLKYDGKVYSIDFEDLEEKLSNPLTTMLILCNPHNPIGKIWSKEELAKIGQLCEKHHVIILSDEIHCDLTEPGHEYTPFASVSRDCAANSITCISASKAFNLAGMQSAAVVIPEEEIRQKMERGLNSDEIAEPNSFAVIATAAAFQEGSGWLKELRSYLWENRKFAAEYLKSEIPNITVVSGHATYLLWLDCGGIIGDAAELCRFIRQETGLYLSEGSQYRGNGNRFIRMNVACPRSRLIEALKRLKTGMEAYEKWVMEQC